MLLQKNIFGIFFSKYSLGCIYFVTIFKDNFSNMGVNPIGYSVKFGRGGGGCVDPVNKHLWPNYSNVCANPEKVEINQYMYLSRYYD